MAARKTAGRKSTRKAAGGRKAVGSKAGARKSAAGKGRGRKTGAAKTGRRKTGSRKTGAKSIGRRAVDDVETVATVAEETGGAVKKVVGGLKKVAEKVKPRRKKTS